MIDAIHRSSYQSNHYITEYMTNEIMLKDFEPRIYQQTILAKCVHHNTLVVLPTGMGKTSIALMLAVQRIRQFPSSKVLFLAPTKPLVEQHKQVFLSHLDNIEEDQLAVFTGFVKPDKRQQLWQDSQIIFATPQGIENDVVSRRISVEDVSLLIVDEAHRTVGDYAYTFLVKQYMEKARFPKVLGLTASPGSDIEKITEVCENLHIDHVEIRTDEDPDVRPYIQEVDLTWVAVDFPEELKKIQNALVTCYTSKLQEMSSLGYLHKEKISKLGKGELLRLQAQLHGEIGKGEKNFEVLKSISLSAEAMKIQHALELLETQSIHALQLYFQKLQEESITTKVKAVQNLVRDEHFKAACILTSSAVEKNIEHPKRAEIQRLVSSLIEKGAEKIILFNQFRDTAASLVDQLNKMNNVQAKLFVGQAKKAGTGLSQKKQKEMLDQFRSGEFNILVATSVAEEGIDIPAVDAVIFYEPIPSAIRHIQRRGRTGRLERGSVFILMTKGTRDEGYKWSAHHKEKRMYRSLDELKRTFHHLQSREKQKLDRYIAPDLDLQVFVDDREKNNNIIRTLVELGIKVNMKRLTVGDYVLGKSCAVEFKTVKDFVDSIIDGRLLQQLRDLQQYYTRPVVIVEGDEDLYSQRNIHPNAIRGMVATITVSYGIPIIWTKTPKDTAQMLAMIAKREQEQEQNDFTKHTKKPLSLSEQQEYFISSLPGIGPTIAKPLLEKFGTIKNIINASLEDLQCVDGVGEKKALEIQKVFTGMFRG